MLFMPLPAPINPLWFVLLLPLGFFGLLFVVALRELRYTRPYIDFTRVASVFEPQPGQMLAYSNDLPHPSQASDYVRTMTADAEAAGFSHAATLLHAKAPKVKIVAALLIAPDRRTLVLTGSGTVFGMASRQTFLFSPLADGRVLVTTDNNDEGDVARRYITRRYLNVRFPRLWEAHCNRVESRAADVAPFAESEASDALFGMYERRVESMIDRGLARYVDADRLYWRHTAMGATLVCLNFFPQLVGAFSQAWRVNRPPIASTALRPASQMSDVVRP